MSCSDEKLLDVVLSCLPGGDCGGYGGCGRQGCLECAQAIVEGAEVNLCPACSQEQVDLIAAATDRPTVIIKKKFAFIACNGKSAVNEEVSSYKSCQEAKEKGFRRGECRNGCIGLGSCIEICKFGAMSLQEDKVVIDREKCNGCEACSNSNICIQDLIKMIPVDATNFIPCSSIEEDEDVVRSSCGYGCIACGECERACPAGAISIVHNHAVIDYAKCQGCMACAVKCKKKIIVDLLHDVTKLKDKVAFVACRGGFKAGQKYKEMGLTSCKQAVDNTNPKELNLCTTGCTGLGDCTKVCRYDAIHIVNGTAKVDPDKCVGCKDCVYACPKKLIKIVPYKGARMIACSSIDDYEEKREVCGAGCAGCGDCVENCPNNAIYMDGRHAVIDPEICENCHACEYICSRCVIEDREVPEYNYLQRAALKFREGE